MEEILENPGCLTESLLSLTRWLVRDERDTYTGTALLMVSSTLVSLLALQRLPPREVPRESLLDQVFFHAVDLIRERADGTEHEAACDHVVAAALFLDQRVRLQRKSLS